VLAGWPVLDVLPGIRARIVRDMPPLDPALDAVVEQHWQAACARHSLFNGRVFCADRYDAGELDGHWTEYRRVVAQMADPALRAVLGVQSLAVCGVLCCRDGIVVGRRDTGSVYQPGLWQLPPAGSVDQGAARNGGADLHAALLTELREELGLEADAVSAILPLCLVEHPTGVLDLGMQVTTLLSGAAVLAAHKTGGNGEYGELAVVPAPELEAWVAARGGAAAPTLHALLRRVR
jgi:8-oxo-dGTP pyrophosphatase MutT (NUDIX family)